MSNKNINLIGMGGSILGTEAIYDFFIRRIWFFTHKIWFVDTGMSEAFGKGSHKNMELLEIINKEKYIGLKSILIIRILPNL